MKSYTDISQSKKLAQILPVESADMYYKYVLPKSDRIIHTPEIGNPINSLKWYNEGYTLLMSKREPITLSEYCIPCWSLATLLGVTRNYCTRFELTLRTNKKYNLFAMGDNFVYRGFNEYPDGIDNPIDVCVALIEKMHELKLL